MTQHNDPKTYTAEIRIESSLPMSAEKQAAIIGHALVDPRFFLQCARKLKPNYFSQLMSAKVFDLMLSYYKRVGQQPNAVELKNCRELNSEENNARQRIFNHIDSCLANANLFKLDALKPDITTWLHSKILQSAMMAAARYWNAERFVDAAGVMSESVRAYHEAKFEDGVEVDFANFSYYLRQRQEDRKDCLTTGLRLLDEALLGDATTGGLQRGDTTVLLAPSNIGKTTTMITVARHNVNDGKSVLFMSHEGRPDDIRLKMLMCMLNVNERQLFEMYTSEDGAKRLSEATQMLSKYLTYVPFNKAHMKVEDVIPIIDRLQEERKIKTGKGFDLFVCDYPAKLSTEMATKGNLATRHVMDIVYEVYVQLALSNNWHSLVAIQTNREGSKVNKGIDDSRLLMMEDVLEAWGPMTSATNVITLNRSVSAQRNSRMTFYVAKSRSSETGKAIVAKTNFANAMTHSTDMGAVAYFGTSTMEEAVDEWLRTQTGQVIVRNAGSAS